jgi:hypothetical protein
MSWLRRALDFRARGEIMASECPLAADPFV